ncbi:Uncharacterised protein [Salmonella enterica subsp. enterica serovar Bovismorbificans]|uniref:Uncharacterized protein n=1 Tax=Salmonella enterica subsp. enterica serovar Bovismorbificans TaxID=58097 RepID=A0A655C2H1_SALET|nr:Uncharacterised protein [Salmonella enterica subsp. enterica serovar Bovismorbificans]
MFRTHRFNADARFAIGVETRHVTQHQPQFAGCLQTLHHLFIQRVAVFEKVIDRPFFTVRRHQRFYTHLIRLDVVSRLARQNHQLTHDIFSGKIDARIGFGQPLLPGLIHQIGERHRTVKLQEQPG